MKLSHRLETIASFVRKGSKIADIGTDHGYIPIWLVEEGIALSALAMDVRKGPLERAQAHIREHGLEQQISVRLCDGMTGLHQGEADTVIIAGMGGALIVHIMEQGRALWHDVSGFILSPQSEIGEVRHFLSENGFVIRREDMVRDEGKYYTVMEAGQIGAEQIGVEPAQCDREIDFLYGRCLIDGKNEVLKEYLKKERAGLLKIIAGIEESREQKDTDSSFKRLLELKERLALAEAAYQEVNDEVQ